MRTRKPLTAVVALGVAVAVVATPQRHDARAATGGAGELHSIAAARLHDTRSGEPVGARRTIEVDVTARGGVPASNVLAVALDLTVTGATAATTLTAYPKGQNRPRAVALHVAAGETATAGVVVPVGDDGRVVVFNEAGDTDVVVDVTGWYGTSAAPAGDRFHVFSPQPLLDTRETADPLGPGETRRIGVPFSLPGPTQAPLLLRVTVPQATATTRLTVHPFGSARPATTNLTAVPGRAASALVTVTYGHTLEGSGISVFNESGVTHLVVDVVGWADRYFSGDDGRYHPLASATRVWDTRTSAPAGPVAGGGTLRVRVAGERGVPHDATSVLLTVSALRPAAAGTLTVHPDGTPVPRAAQVGYAPARPASSLVAARLGTGGRVAIRASGGPVDVAVDVLGWYSGAGDYVPLPGATLAGGVVVDDESRYAYVTNTALDRVEVLDLATATIRWHIAVGDAPLGLDLTPDGATLYVANRGSHDISVVDVAGRTELRRIPGTTYHVPTDIAVGAHGTALVHVVHPESPGSGDNLLLRLSDDYLYSGIYDYGSGRGALSASRDREFLVAADNGGTPTDLLVLDTTRLRMDRAGIRLRDGIRRTAASSDGTLLAGLPYLVDRVNGEVRTLPGAPYGCSGVAFAPHDDVVYQSCTGNVVTAHATTDLADRGVFRHTGLYWGDHHTSAGEAVATPDGSRVLVISGAGLALVPVGPPYS